MGIRRIQTSGPGIRPWYPPTVNLKHQQQLIQASSNNYRFQSSSDGSFPNPGATPACASDAQMKHRHQLGLINPRGWSPRSPGPVTNSSRAQNQYLIALRDLRLQVAQSLLSICNLSDENVCAIGQESFRASLVSCAMPRARFPRRVFSTKLEVASRPNPSLTPATAAVTTALAISPWAVRTLASFLDLPHDVHPTGQGSLAGCWASWLPSLQESIVAAYAFREELDQIILDILNLQQQRQCFNSGVQAVLEHR